MTFGERLRAIDRAQRSRLFKLAASGVIVALAIAGFGYYFVRVTSGDVGAAAEAGPARDATAVASRAVQQVLEGSADVTGVGVGVLIGVLVALVIVWLGLGLTYLALAIVAAGIALPLSMFDATAVYARLLVGVVALTASFTALMQALRVLFSGPGPVLAIARNVLAEAVRLKISLVFIVLLIIGLASLPGLLNETQPLRYRVQSFLQYGTGGAFWIIAILTLFFATATVTFEQRDKIIWQTMTKPVAAWQFLLGKWLGVVGLNAVLLAVCASGVFLFTEYLRSGTALGEIEPYVTAQGDISEDRLILETQVLAARRVVDHMLPFDPGDERFDAATQQRIERERRQQPDFGRTPAEVRRVRQEIVEAAVQSYRSIDPQEGYERFYFDGLGGARERGLPLTLQYRVNAEGNRPDVFYRVTFALPDGQLVTRQVGLGYYHQISISPEYIADDGTLVMEVFNGELVPQQGGGLTLVTNPSTMTFPPDGLAISYPAGSFRLNFLRVVVVLWVKLAFLAMIAVWASTFLSFPVACLVAFGVFLAAEGSTFIADSLEYFGTTDEQGNFSLYRFTVSVFASSVAQLFSVYAGLRPTGRLVDGVLLPWRSVAGGTIFLAVVSAVLYLIGIFIFRRRELATYSGQ